MGGADAEKFSIGAEDVAYEGPMQLRLQVGEHSRQVVTSTMTLQRSFGQQSAQPLSASPWLCLCFLPRRRQSPYWALPIACPVKPYVPNVSAKREGFGTYSPLLQRSL